MSAPYPDGGTPGKVELPQTTTQQPLPHTGTAPTDTVLAGTGIILLGVALVVAARRWIKS